MFGGGTRERVGFFCSRKVDLTLCSMAPIRTSSFWLFFLVAILHRTPLSVAQDANQVTSNSSSTTPSSSEPAKLEATREPPSQVKVTEVEAELPKIRERQRPERLERIDEDFFRMSPYGMNNMAMSRAMPMYPSEYFYPHRMAPTLPPYEERPPTEDRNADRRRVPHPRLIAAPLSHISAEINTISGNPNFASDEMSRPFGFQHSPSARKKKVYEPVYFDDESVRRPYSYGVRSRPRERTDPRFKPSLFEMPNGHSEAFETEPILVDIVPKRGRGQAYDDDEDFYGLRQSDKKLYRGGRRKAVLVPTAYATRGQLNEEDVSPSSHHIEEGYQPPYRNFVLGHAGYELVQEANPRPESASDPTRVDHVPLVGESRRRLITLSGAKEYFSDETEDYFPSGGFKLERRDEEEKGEEKIE